MAAQAGGSLEERMVEALGAVPEGINTQKLQRSLKCTAAELAAAGNKLLMNHRVVILRSGTGALFYKLNEAGRAMKLQDILPEEQLVLQHVEKAGNKGVWLKILRLQTRLQSAQLKKILKNLAKRKLVKSVKSITAYREVWVAWGVEPDKTVTGGKWYTDSKLDTEFITHLSEAVYVALQSGPRSRAQLLEMLAQVGVSSVALTPSDVQDILDILVYDGMVEEMPTYVSAGPAVPSTLAAARGLAGAGTPSAAAGGAGTTAADRKKYRVSKQVEHYNFMCQAPCGACPVRQHCHPGGTISPEKCVYMDAWLFDG